MSRSSFAGVVVALWLTLVGLLALSLLTHRTPVPLVETVRYCAPRPGIAELAHPCQDEDVVIEL